MKEETERNNKNMLALIYQSCVELRTDLSAGVTVRWDARVIYEIFDMTNPSLQMGWGPFQKADLINSELKPELRVIKL